MPYLLFPKFAFLFCLFDLSKALKPKVTRKTTHSTFSGEFPEVLVLNPTRSARLFGRAVSGALSRCAARLYSAGKTASEAVLNYRLVAAVSGRVTLFGHDVALVSVGCG